MPTVLNGANEFAVAAFLEGRIGFPDIARTVEETCAAHNGPDLAPATIADAIEIDGEARRIAAVLISKAHLSRSGGRRASRRS